MELETASHDDLLAEIDALRRHIARLEAGNDHATGSALNREALFQALLDASPAAIYAKDLAGRYLFVNHQAQQHINQPLTEILGKTNYALYAQDVADDLAATDALIIQTKQPSEREVTVAAGATTRSYLASKFPLFDHLGQLYAIGGVATDITERKQAEQQLRANAEQYRVLFEANPLPLWIVDRKTLAFLAVNNAAVEQYGYTRAELLAMTLRDVRPAEDIPVLLDRIRRSEHARQQSEVPILWRSDVRHQRKNGSIIYVEVVSQMLTYAEREAWIIVLHDITARKQTEAALRESEALYQALSTASFESIIIHDNGKIVAVNQVLCDLVGYAADELIGKTYAAFLDQDDVPIIAQKLLAGDTDLYTAHVIRKDGSRFYMEGQPKTIRYRGHVMAVMAIRDVTERRRTEEALRRSQEQLMQSQRLELVGRLAGGIAHDFNNLLTAITGYGSLILDTLDEHAAIRPDLAEILQAAERASDLTHQLLAYSRRQLLQPTLINLNNVVTAMERMLRRLIGEDIDLLVELDPILEHTMLDRGQIEQVLMNIVVNARDAMPHGGRLTIETANVDLDEAYHSNLHSQVKTGAYVLLAITDTGIGIDAETQTHIFEPFYTTKEVGKGTGLGLSTVYGIVKQSGGYVWVYSEIEVGTTFKIYFPAVTAIETMPLPPPLAVSTSHAGSEVILVVEDEEQVRTLVQRVLSMHGYRVLTATYGNEGLALWRERAHIIDLVITDIVMPQMSGRELIALIHAESPHVRTLCMSGYTNRVVREHDLVSPCQAFLPKPFTPLALISKVRQVLDLPVGSSML